MTESSDSFEALFASEEKKTVKKLTPGQKITATVVGIRGENTFVDVGGKSEGVMNTSEFADAEGNPMLEIGDKVEVYFLQSKGGERFFTRSIGSGASAAHIEEAFRAAVPVEGFVKSEIKGGFDITLGGNIRAFCPFSQMGLRRVEDAATEYLEKHMTFLITRFEENGRNIVVSARAIQEQEREEKKEKLKETLEEGQVVKGEISSIRDFGAFVDLGGVDGLIPVSEIGWSRVDKVEDYFSVGQQVEVVVKSLDWDKERISLSYKATQRDPWEDIPLHFPEGTTVTGKVARLAQFGAFVTIAPGIDGLIHISRLGGGRRINHPREVLEEGQDVEVRVESIDLESHRLSLAPTDYISEESEAEKEKSEYRAFSAKKKEQKAEKSMGSLGALLQAKLKEKVK
ncbi:30S ribosomal protein S1 [Desulforhopalus vacuolatus]|uniref:30S ribosomal protein S1 n=1 Tax=Desulforhopalus vacuolatus TaxID=40414 RepID=UPI0019656843|nr:30S ribosomal protein S1 [Desulforhopalus vacuolatus]MBM9520144.1 30S ribosomal protein S1 [Desulforhopalus vacuolatus]